MTMIFLVGEMPGSLLRAAGRPFQARLELAPCATECPRQGRLELVGCDDCPHLVVDGAERPGCLTSGVEPAGQWMSPLARLATVAPEQPCAVAVAVAERAGLHHLLVLDADRTLVGIVCRCDLARTPGGTVAQAMSGDVFAIGPATTLSEAAALMRLLTVGCLPVLGEGVVLGLITRDQLEQAGAPA